MFYFFYPLFSFVFLENSSLLIFVVYLFVVILKCSVFLRRKINLSLFTKLWYSFIIFSSYTHFVKSFLIFCSSERF